MHAVVFFGGLFFFASSVRSSLVCTYYYRSYWTATTMGLEVEVRCIYRWMDILIAKIDVFRKKNYTSFRNKNNSPHNGRLADCNRTNDRPTDRQNAGRTCRPTKKMSCVAISWTNVLVAWLNGVLFDFSCWVSKELSNRTNQKKNNYNLLHRPMMTYIRIEENIFLLHRLHTQRENSGTNTR